MLFFEGSNALPNGDRVELTNFQCKLLESYCDGSTKVITSRRCGISTTNAFFAIWKAIMAPKVTIVMCEPSHDMSRCLQNHMRDIYNTLKYDSVSITNYRNNITEFSNGSIIRFKSANIINRIVVYNSIDVFIADSLNMVNPKSIDLLHILLGPYMGTAILSSCGDQPNMILPYCDNIVYGIGSDARI